MHDMSMAPENPPAALRPRPPRPFRAAVLRGLGGFIPPLMTVVVFFWVFGTVDQYVLGPVQRGTNEIIAHSLALQYVLRPEEGDQLKYTATIGGQSYKLQEEGIWWTIRVNGTLYYLTSDYSFVTADMFKLVRNQDGNEVTKKYTGLGICDRYAQLKFMRWYYVIPAFLALFTLFLYFLGKLLAGRLGQFVWEYTERLIRRVPLVRNVYSSVKQVTEFFLNQRELEFTRVVAIEYPRKDCWAVASVTGESLLDVTEAAGEPALSVLVPTSPMPITGFTCIVLKREVVDLNITIDQALEYIISCGVVVPPHQLQLALRQKNERERGRKHNAHRKPLTVMDGQTRPAGFVPMSNDEGRMTKE
jgi:uncharacterized membrane protein